MFRTHSIGAAVAVVAGVGAGAGASVTLTNFASFGGTQDPFSNQQTTAGLVFTAPVGNTAISDFTFKLVRGFGTFGVSAHLYRWDGQKASGPSLYDSGSFDISGVAFTFEDFTFNTGEIAVSPGTQYIAFLTRSKYSGNAGGLFPGVLLDNSPWNMGTRTFFGNQGNFEALLSTPWSAPGHNFKLAFRANFVPSPGAAGVMGIAGLAAAARRRRR